MTTVDGRVPAAEDNNLDQPIGRVNLNVSDSEDPNGSWSLKAILIGVLALGIMIMTLLVVLPWALDAPPI